jgi:hypothetical protein
MAPLAFLLCMTQVSRVITGVCCAFMKNAAVAGISLVGSCMLLFLLVAMLQWMINQLLKLP